MREQLEQQYAQREPLLKEMARNLEQETLEILQGLEHVDRISFRVKGRESFLRKALDPENNPPYHEPLVEIEDQVAGRIIVFFLGDIPIVRDKLARTFNTVEWSKRRPARDEEFGYESDHIVSSFPPHVLPNGWHDIEDLPRTFEIQIRTIFMHAYAEPQHDLAYKAAAELPGDTRRELAWIAASAWGSDQAYERLIQRWRRRAGGNG